MDPKISTLLLKSQIDFDNDQGHLQLFKRGENIKIITFNPEAITYQQEVMFCLSGFRSIRSDLDLHFNVVQPPSFGCIVKQVISSFACFNCRSFKSPIRREMERQTEKHQLGYEVYISRYQPTNETQTNGIEPMVAKYQVKIASSSANYLYEFMDSHWSTDLWSSAANSHLTDVKFTLAEKKAIYAHRVILSIRSPVFNELLSKKAKGTESMIQIEVEDVEYQTFRHFLKFVYTGMLNTSANDHQLNKLAGLYKIETLEKMCQFHANRQDVDLEDVLSLIHI